MKANYGTCPSCGKRVRLCNPLHTGKRPVGMHWVEVVKRGPKTSAIYPCDGRRMICVEDDSDREERRTRQEVE